MSQDRNLLMSVRLHLVGVATHRLQYYQEMLILDALVKLLLDSDCQLPAGPNFSGIFLSQSLSNNSFSRASSINIS